MSIHSYSRLLIHLVWSTKYRQRILPKGLRKMLHTFLLEYAREHKIDILECYVNSDHVHVLINCKPNRQVSDIVKHLKGASSRWLNAEDHLQRKFAWGRGFGAFSVSESHRRVVIHYICNQAQHHQGKTYTEEFSEEMEKHSTYPPTSVGGYPGPGT